MKIWVLLLITQVCFAGISSARPPADAQYRVIRIAPPEANQPISITEVKVKGINITPNSKFLSEEDWLDGLTIRIKNESNKTILFASVDLHFQRPAGSRGLMAVNTISFGNGALLLRTPTLEQTAKLMPDETATMSITGEELSAIKQLLEQNGYPADIETIKLKIGRVIFDDDSMWYSGTYLSRDPKNSRTWIRGSAR